MKFVSIIMGSKSDYEVVSECAKILKDFGVAYEMIISSAHRSPKRTAEYVANAEKKGAQVFVCAAGMAAHLAGAVAANTTKPVIGIPMGGGALNGLDALYSTVQNARRYACGYYEYRKSRSQKCGLFCIANFGFK